MNEDFQEEETRCDAKRTGSVFVRLILPCIRRFQLRKPDSALPSLFQEDLKGVANAESGRRSNT
jgi:hypothetical protein